MSHGLIIPGRDKTVDGKNLWYDSRNPKMQIALDRDPVHLDIINIGGGTALTSPSTFPPIESNTTKTETLFSMEHHLPYTPRVLVYIYVSPSTTVGYAVGTAISDGGGGPVLDYWTYEVTDTKFSIIHKVTDQLGIGYVSTAPSKMLRIKYMIFSIPVNKKVSDV